jgi:hypothetical protein
MEQFLVDSVYSESFHLNNPLGRLGDAAFYRDVGSLNGCFVYSSVANSVDYNAFISGSTIRVSTHDGNGSDYLPNQFRSVNRSPNAEESDRKPG